MSTLEARSLSPRLEIPNLLSALTLGDAVANWQKVLMHVQKVLKQPNVAAIAREGRPVELSGSVLTIGFSKKYEFHRDRTQQAAAIIAGGFEEVMRAKVKIATRTIADAGAGEPVAERAAEAKQQPEQHPLINEVLTMFDGTIVPDDKSLGG